MFTSMQTDTALYASYLEDSLTQLQDVIRGLHHSDDEKDDDQARKRIEKNTRGNPLDYFCIPETSVHDDHTLTTPYSNAASHPPLPLASFAKKTTKTAGTKLRRHHTISSGNPASILAARRAYIADRGSDNEAMSDDVLPWSRKSSLNDEEVYHNNINHNNEQEYGADGDSVAFDFQIRLNSPDPIVIPERYWDNDLDVELEDDVGRRRRRAKAEDIRRMLAVPE